jgi:dipeptidyl aminopeptidase/acylaminoacyl peptidase
MKPIALALVALSLAGSAPAADQARRVTLEGIEPAWSPDGRRLAYVAPAQGGATDLFVVDADGGHRGRLTRTGTVDELAPDWSPDGKRLVVERAGEIFVLRADGSAERGLVAGWEPAWSPGGRRIAFVRDGRLHVIPVTGGRPRKLTAAPGVQRAPAWSPNGRRIAFVSDASGFPDVYVLDLRSGSVRRLTADQATDASPSFTQNGRNVVYVSDRDGANALWRVRAVGGTPVRVARIRSAADAVVRPAPSKVELLPDLEQRPPADLSVRTVVRRGRPHFLLGFDSATDNIGLGPVMITARRSSRRSRAMHGAQVVRLAGGGRQTYPAVGVLRYVRSSTHSHWHVMGFQRYELRRVSDYALFVRDRKSGFCLADHWAQARGHFLNEPRGPVFKGNCEQGRPEALAVYEGTSVGYTDRYPSHFHGQNLDITGVPAGSYDLIHRANRSLLFRELRYENNAASLRIRISSPDGRRRPPSVEIVRTCPDSDRC